MSDFEYIWGFDNRYMTKKIVGIKKKNTNSSGGELLENIADPQELLEFVFTTWQPVDHINPNSILQNGHNTFTNIHIKQNELTYTISANYTSDAAKKNLYTNTECKDGFTFKNATFQKIISRIKNLTFPLSRDGFQFANMGSHSLYTEGVLMPSKLLNGLILTGTSFSNIFQSVQFNLSQPKLCCDLSTVIKMDSAFSISNITTNLFNDASLKTTTGVTDMSQMYFNCKTFNDDISSLKTSSVINMSDMFTGAASFNHDLSGWDVKKVTNMSQMFNGATLFNQDLSGWDIKKVTSMTDIFNGTILKRINGTNAYNIKSKWSTYPGWRVSPQLANCFQFEFIFSGLNDYLFIDTNTITLDNMSTYLPINSGNNSFKFDFDLLNGKPQYIADTDSGPLIINKKLTLYILRANSSSILFNDGFTFGVFLNTDKSESTIPQYILDTKDTAIGSIDYFYKINSLTFPWSIAGYQLAFTPNFDSSSCIFTQEGNNPFSKNVVILQNTSFEKICYKSNLSGMNTYWNTSNVTNMSSAFVDTNNITPPLITSYWNTSGVTTMAHMFQLSSFSAYSGEIATKLVTVIKNSSGNNINLDKNQQYTAWDISNVNDMSYMFAYIKTNEFQIDSHSFSGWDTTNVHDMSYMFELNPSFNGHESLNCFTVSNVTNTSNMFYACKNFITILDCWNLPSESTAGLMFSGTTFASLTWSNINITEKCRIHAMFTSGAWKNFTLSELGITATSVPLPPASCPKPPPLSCQKILHPGYCGPLEQGGKSCTKSVQIVIGYINYIENGKPVTLGRMSPINFVAVWPTSVTVKELTLNISTPGIRVKIMLSDKIGDTMTITLSNTTNTKKTYTLKYDSTTNNNSIYMTSLDNPQNNDDVLFWKNAAIGNTSLTVVFG